MTFNRRTFLRISGAGAVAVGVTGASAPAVAAPRWDKLRAKLKGPLYLPSDPGYEGVRTGFMTMFDDHFPAAVAKVARPEDVQACVEFAANHDIPIAARSGGHGYAGYSTPHQGLVVDLGPLNAIQVHPDGRAVVGAGARLGEVYTAVAKAGRLLPAGSCATVGIGGLALGGGIGVLGRKYGLTCDRVISMRVVTPDGRLRTVSAISEPELFWALRGGGGGNFGIVTSFTFDTAPARDLSVFALGFVPEALPAVLAAWHDWVLSAPDEMWASIGISGGVQPSFGLEGCFAGPASAAAPILDDLIRRVGSKPTSRSAKDLSYYATMEYYGGCGDFTAPKCGPSWSGGKGEYARGAYVGASRMISAPLSDPARFAEVVTATPTMYTIVDTFGGAIARGDSAFPHRDATSSTQILLDVGPSTGDEAAVRRQVGQVRDEIGKMTGPTGYVNYLDPEMPDWAHAYYGRNLPRLRRVASRYDPDGLFAFAQGLSTKD
ncbi:FAD-binding oxidoreductase [Amycolatopsis sp. NPDC059657]|uniref:FAD-binding oxidoreductase n=1 Tax=Amycolatopsis sp. NPDC059657 TaxID=3346899 RepID=UPI003671EC2A